MRKNLTFAYALQQTILWAEFGFLIAFAYPYLTEQTGLTDGTAGLVLGIATATAFLLQPLLTTLVDKTRLNTRAVSLLISAMGAAFAGAAAVTAGGSALFFGAACVCLQIAPAFSNAMGMQAIRVGYSLNFAVARACGSISFGVAAKLTAVLISKFGNQAIAAAAAISAALFCLVTLAFPSVHTTEEAKKPTPIKDFFRENPRFLFVLLASVLMYIGHNALSNAMYRVVESKLPAGVAETAVTDLQGTVLMVVAFLELPTMFLFRRLLKKLRCDVWLGISCVCMTLRLLLTWLLPGEMGILLAQLTQMGGYAIYVVATVYYVGSVISKENVVKGQTYLGASNTLGCLIAYFVGGTLTEHFGVEAMLLTSLATAVLGTVIMFLSMERVDQTAGTDE